MAVLHRFLPSTTPCACADLGGADEQGEVSGISVASSRPLAVINCLVLLCVRGEMPSGKQSEEVWEVGQAMDGVVL